jgi:apolipoprotein N-acyltransferase
VAFWRAFTQPVRYAALAAGALPVLAFPEPNLEFVAWFGLVPGLLLFRAAPSWRDAAVRGWWFGAGFLLASLYWLVPNLGPGLLLVAIVIGVLWTGVGTATWGLLRAPVTARRALAALAVVPSFWLVADWARSWQGFGGPWAVYGASQWQHPVILALAALGGVWLVSFVLVAANTGVLILLAARRIPVRLIGAAGAAVAIAAGPVAYALTAAAPVSRYVTIAMVQPGVVHNPKIRVDASQRLTASLARDRADLIVWGESSVGYDLDTHPGLLRELQALSAARGAQLLVNQDSISPSGVKSKVALLIGGNGIDGRYVKTRLVPFGEYIPFRQALGWLTTISKAAPQNMLHGNGAHVMTVTPSSGPPFKIGVLICFESAFPDMSRVDADRGAQLIVYQTSDSTWQAGWEWVLAQHAALGALRAAESGRPVLQAALTGDSVAFGPQGQLVTWKGSSFRGVAAVRLGLPPVSARTLYDRLGDYVPWTATAIAALAAAVALTRTNRRKIGPNRPSGIVLDGNPLSDRPGTVTGSAAAGSTGTGSTGTGSTSTGSTSTSSTATGASGRSSDGSPAAAPRAE